MLRWTTWEIETKGYVAEKVQMLEIETCHKPAREGSATLFYSGNFNQQIQLTWTSPDPDLTLLLHPLLPLQGARMIALGERSGGCYEAQVLELCNGLS